MKKRLILIISVILFVLISIIAISGIVIYKDVNDLNVMLGRSGASATELIAKSHRVSSEVDLVIGITQLPIVRSAISATGFNFGSIRSEIKTVIRNAPNIAGASGAKRYLIVFQNSAEARGTGGIMGAYAVVEFNKGNLKVVKTGSNEPLYGLSLDKIPIDVPAEFLKLYGQNPAIIQNSNLSPHFPYGAEIWLALWQKKYNENLDGVIAVDPTALSYILRATGPLKMDTGIEISDKNVVAETLKDAYKRYESDNHARKQYLVEIMNVASAKLQSNEYSKIKLAQAIRDGILENRILFYSTDKDVQSQISKTRLGGAMQLSPNNEYRAVIQNTDAGKLDYYLDRDVKISSKSCGVDRESQVQVRVTNSLASAAGLPAYVLTRADKDKPKDLIPGSHRFKLFIYGPTNSTLVSVWRENKNANLGGAATERGRPVYVADVDLAPGGSEELLANFKGGEGRITFVKQPLVREATLTIKDNC